MRAFNRFAVALFFAVMLVVLMSTSLVLAEMAMIETTATLNEQSNEGVKKAVATAVETAVRGAQAMGLSRVALNGVRVLPRMVIVQILATDSATESTPDEHDQDLEKGSLERGETSGLRAMESGLHAREK